MAEAKKPADDTVEVTVLRGTIRTGSVVYPDGDTSKRGDQVFEHHGPGAKLSVPRSELAGLIAHGRIVNPNAPAIPVGQGPTFTSEGGPTIQETADI